MSIALNIAALLLVLGISWFGVIWLASFFHKDTEGDEYPLTIQAASSYETLSTKNRLVSQASEFSNTSTPKLNVGEKQFFLFLNRNLEK